VGKADFILADLGVSSVQLADAEIGLSFAEDMPLDMRMDKGIKISAADIINRMGERELADLIYKYGEDRASKRIARFIVQQRRQQPIITTGRLSEVVCRALGVHCKQGHYGRRERIHPATRTFQALRIAVNNELENLESLLEESPALLKKDGRIAIISFHSLEDRLVKQNFIRNKQAGVYKIITKKPIMPDREEITQNRRSRSAKLRIAQKI
jgi:16S rRNA (cytosine1402-N4)-methyltransferase